MKPLSTTAGDWHVGATCAACGATIGGADRIVQCGRCGTVHHLDCWQGVGCAGYDCAPTRRALAPGSAAATGIVISSEELAKVTLLPKSSGDAARRVATQPDPPVKWSRAAIAAMILAVVGVPLFGIVTGAIAVVLAAIALGGIRAGYRRGVWLASGALLLGLIDVVGWAALLSWHFGGGTPTHINLADFRISPAELDSAPPQVANALRGNVLITVGGMLGESIGAGVILSIKGDSALILTNSHVIGAQSVEDAASKRPLVQFVDGVSQLGEVVWVGSHGVDAALVRAPASGGAAAALYEKDAAPRIGDQVFAIGNPNGLGWTHTAGAISQFRERDAAETTLRVIQTSAPVNPGNSGGGLYDARGRLLGIITWSGDKRVSEGLGFAITIDSLAPLFPVWLEFDGLVRP